MPKSKGDPNTVVQLHNIVGEKGAVVRGTTPLVELATGNTEPLTCVIATGHEHTTPRLLVSANIHGNEVNGLIVAHRLIAALEAAVQAKTLVGTVVVYPSLNPTGLRAATRTPSFSSDANRLWPSQEPKPDTSSAPGDGGDEDEGDPLATFLNWDEPSAQEQAWSDLLAEWATAGFDYHIDLHTAGTPLNSTWTYLDRVVYNEEDESFTKADAEALYDLTLKMVTVMGCTILLSGSLSLIRSSPAYFFRATSGATHHGLHIPAVTLEAGPHDVAEPAHRDAASAAIHNVMSWSGMLPGTSPIDVSKITPAHLNVNNLHRELSYPIVRKRGVVDLVVPAGASFAKGDTLANVRSLDGTLLEEICADFDGHVLSWKTGVVRMEGESLGRKNGIFFGVFPMFVPSLSWQNDRFYT